VGAFIRNGDGYAGYARSIGRCCGADKGSDRVLTVESVSREQEEEKQEREAL
jgi:hypothetical protein